MSTLLLGRQKTFGRRLVSVLIVLAIVWPALVSPASADSPLPQNQVPGWVESKAHRLANGLRSPTAPTRTI